MTAPYRDVLLYAGTPADKPGDFASNYGYYGEQPSSFIQSLIDQGIITQSSRDYSNESGTGTITTNQVDWDKLPAFGKPAPAGKQWIPAYDNTGLINPNLVYDDPNYGKMTIPGNFKSDLGDWHNLIGPALMALVTFGAGSLPVWGGITEAAMGAGAAGAVAGDAFLPGALSGTFGLSSTPWYINAGLNAAKTVGSKALGVDKPDPIPMHPNTTIPMSFTPSLFGNSTGTPPAVPTGSAPVATSVAPDAYGQSYNYNQVVT